jgi:acyl-[acyl-carrier-protein] desaturase
MRSVADVVTGFRMPGHGMPGFERAAAQMAIGGIYNLRIHHDDVLQPVLRKLKVMEVTGLGPEGLQAQQELGVFLEGLDTQATRFDERQAAILARRQAAQERRAG